VALRDQHELEILASPADPKHDLALIRRALGGRMLRPVMSPASSTPNATCDVVLDLRAGAPIANDALKATPYWYFCDGDGRTLGDLPGATEIARGLRTFTIQLRERTQPGSTSRLRTGTFKLLYAYARSLEVALNECSRWPAIALSKPTREHAASGTHGSLPTRRLKVIAFLLNVARAFFTHAYKHLFLDARWEVGLVAGSPADFLRGGFVPDIHWLRESSGFFADPFVLTTMGRQYILGERLDSETRNGFIACVEFGTNGQVLHENPIMKSSTHLSYPYVFEHDGTWYMVPENAQAERAVLYRAVEAPFRWEPFVTLVDGVGSCDNTVVRHDDRWWLFCTHPSRDANLNLFLYHAADLRGPWMPHPANPVKTDIRSARPAGTPFVVNGALYRPAQNCVRSYGDAIAFNRITALDEERFSEDVVATLDCSNAGKRSAGVHTISYSNGTVAIDSKTVTRANGKLVRRRLAELVLRALSFAT
jgi:hypothetical protein